MGKPLIIENLFERTFHDWSDDNLKKTIVVVILAAALILAAFSMLSAPRVRADTSEVQVLSYSWYVAPSNTVRAEWAGDLVAVGEVQNVGSNVIGSVVVAGAAYDSTGQVLATTQTQAFVNNILPGQKAPFYLDFFPEYSVTQDQSWVPSVTNVTVSATYVNDTSETPYSGLTIPSGSSTSYLDSSGTFTVTSVVQNTGSETTGHVWVVTTFYNASGTVVALNYTGYLSDSLAPGASVQFTVTPTDNTAQLSSAIANYSLLIQSEPLTSSVSPSPSSSIQPSSSPTISPPSSTQPTQSPAPTSSELIYAVAGVIVVIVVIIVALMLFRKRHT